MDDDRGNLALEYLKLADRLRPEWLVWENVVGVLSSNSGRDFGAFLGGLGELGYGWAYRVLDASDYGLAQRRKRVYVVANRQGWQRASAVLFKRECLSWSASTNAEARLDDCTVDDFRADSGGESCHNIAEPNGRLFGTLLASGAGLDRPAGVASETSFLIVGRDADGNETVRRPTPIEAERLQGFADDYTLVPYKGKMALDIHRYAALGNSMAVPVVGWIGARIDLVNSITHQAASKNTAAA